MERLKHIKESLISCVQANMGNLKEVDTHELGEAIDMIKDMEEAIYYCSISKAMEENEKEKKYSQQQPMYYPVHVYNPISGEYAGMRDMDRDYGRMYYPNEYENRSRMNYPYNMNVRNYGGQGSNGGSSQGGNSNGGMRNFEEYGTYPMEIRDVREGKSPMSRRNYMESKELHHDTSKKMKELEKYLQELSQDITEMIQDSSPEEKAMLQQKLSTLATKIKNV